MFSIPGPVPANCLTDDGWLSDGRGAREGDLVGRGGERQAPAAAEAAERVRRLCQEVVREATPGEEPSVRFAGEWIFSFAVFTNVKKSIQSKKIGIGVQGGAPKE